MNVTIIDDNKTLTDAIKVSLENYKPQWSINIFNDGVSALESIPTDLPDIMFIDITLPEMSGLDILKEVKSIDKDIQVIMITAYPTIDNIKTALRYGALDFIQKPVHMKDIVSVLQTATDKRQLLLDSREVIANLIKSKEDAIETSDMFSLLDRTLMIDNFQKKTMNINNVNEFIETSVNELKIIFNTPYVYFYLIEDDKPMRVNSVSSFNDSKADKFIEAHNEEIAGSSRMNISERDIIGYIRFEKLYFGFIYIYRDFDFKAREMEILSTTALYSALKFKKINVMRKTDSHIGTLILTLITLSNIKDTDFKHIVELSGKISVKFSEFLKLDIDAIEEIRYASFLYHYLKAENNAFDIESFSKIIEHMLCEPSEIDMMDFENTISSKTDQIVLLQKLINITSYIDEHFDGTGKREFKGEKIPFESRILAITTAFSTIFLSDIKNGKVDIKKIVENMYKLCNKHFDGELLYRFSQFIDECSKDAQLMIKVNGGIK